MTGSSIFDYVHHQDHSEVAEHLGLSLANGQGLASPSSGASDEGGGSQGTNNPDGKQLRVQRIKDFHIGFTLRLRSHDRFFLVALTANQVD